MLFVHNTLFVYKIYVKNMCLANIVKYQLNLSGFERQNFSIHPPELHPVLQRNRRRGMCDKFYLTCLSETYINKIRVNQSVRARIWLLREWKPFREIYMSTEQCTYGKVTPGSDWRWWILTPHVGAVVASAVPTMLFPHPHQILHLVIGYIAIVTSY